MNLKDLNCKVSCRGLRDSDWGSRVKVLDAETGKFKRWSPYLDFEQAMIITRNNNRKRK